METISDLEMGKPQKAANLTMVPLSGNPAAALSYILVDEALRKKEVVVGRSPHHAAHSIRKLNVMHHKETLKSRQGYRSAQGEVWSHVARMSHAMEAPSTTGAMHDVYEQKKGSFVEFGKKLRTVRGQTGAAFLVGDIFAGLDLFDRPATLKSLFPKLLSAVAVEAMMAGAGGKGDSKTGTNDCPAK